MADDIVFQSTTPATPLAGERVSLEEVTTLNAGAVTAQKVQRVAPSIITANGTAVDVTAAAPLPAVLPKASTASAAAQTAQGTTAAQVLAANTSRKQLIVVNTGTTTIKLVLGAGTPTQTVYHIALRGAGVADDGSGGSYVSDTWTGAVQAISSAASGTLVVTELT